MFIKTTLSLYDIKQFVEHDFVCRVVAGQLQVVHIDAEGGVDVFYVDAVVGTTAHRSDGGQTPQQHLGEFALAYHIYNIKVLKGEYKDNYQVVFVCLCKFTLFSCKCQANCRKLAQKMQKNYSPSLCSASRTCSGVGVGMSVSV